MNIHPLKIILFLAIMFPRVAEADTLNFSPAVSFSRGIYTKGHIDIRAAGPLFHYIHSGKKKAFAISISPFISIREENAGTVTQIFWPFLEFSDTWYESRNRAFIYNSYSDKNGASFNFNVFPFWFSGSGPGGDFYWAFLPFYGEVHSLAGYDRIFFFCFPFYLETRKGKLKGKSCLWPFYYSASGGEREKWRIFPFYGYNSKKGHFINRFVMWPFFTSSDSLSESAPSSGWMLWPLVGFGKYGSRVSRSFLWPLFEIVTGEKGKLAGLDILWPFFQFRDGFPAKRDKRFYFWPLFGESRNGKLNKSFILWPLFRQKAVTDAKGNVIHGSSRLWPFFSLTKKNGIASLSVLDLWPLEDMAGIEKNYSPLWTLFRYSSAPEGYGVELLWGMFSLFDIHEGESGVSIAWIYNRTASGGNGEERITVNDYLGGLFSVVYGPGDKVKRRLFWCLDF
jgi:hypothetical protein